MRNECYCILEETCCVSHREQLFTDPAALVFAGTLAADTDSALLKTLQHLHEMPVSVLLNIFQLMAEPVGFWRETSPPQRLTPWLDSWLGNLSRCAEVYLQKACA